MFRRSFTTTARLFSRTDGKPPTGEPSVPPPPRNDAKPKENLTKPDNSSKDEDTNIVELFASQFKPRSKHFILAFANPRIPAEERSRQLLLITMATFTAWITEPWMMPIGQSRWFPSREEYLIDLITNTIVNSPSRRATASPAE